ncbi:MAG TPA: hypothetical protein VHC22_14185 [Pirellulales bacterium]|nr:hypothetical protein [Pirellulales bacterium]
MDTEEVRDREPFEIEALEERIAPSVVTMNNPWQNVQWTDAGGGSGNVNVFLGYDPP